MGLFLTPVLTLWGGGHIDHHIPQDLRTLLLPNDSPRDNLYVCMI